MADARFEVDVLVNLLANTSQAEAAAASIAKTPALATQPERLAAMGASNLIGTNVSEQGVAANIVRLGEGAPHPVAGSGTISKENVDAANASLAAMKRDFEELDKPLKGLATASDDLLDDFLSAQQKIVHFREGLSLLADKTGEFSVTMAEAQASEQVYAAELKAARSQFLLNNPALHTRLIEADVTQQQQSAILGAGIKTNLAASPEYITAQAADTAATQSITAAKLKLLAGTEDYAKSQADAAVSQAQINATKQGELAGSEEYTVAKANAARFLAQQAASLETAKALDPAYNAAKSEATAALASQAASQKALLATGPGAEAYAQSKASAALSDAQIKANIAAQAESTQAKILNTTTTTEQTLAVQKALAADSTYAANRQELAILAAQQKAVDAKTLAGSAAYQGATFISSTAKTEQALAQARLLQGDEQAIANAGELAATNAVIKAKIRAAEVEASNSAELVQATVARKIAEKEYATAVRDATVKAYSAQGQPIQSFAARFDRSGQGSLGALSSVTRILPLVAAFGAFTEIKDAVTESIALQEHFSQIQAQLQGMGQEDAFPKLRDDILSVAAATGTASDKVAALAQQTTGAFAGQTVGGLSGEPLTSNAIDSISKLAAVGKAPIAELGSGVDTIAQSFNALPSTVANAMNRVSQVTGVKVGDISSALAESAGVFKQYGYNLNDASAILAQGVERTGKSATSVADGYNRILTGFDQKITQLQSNLSSLPTLDNPEFRKALAGGNVKQILDLANKGFQSATGSQQDQIAQFLQISGGRREAQFLLPSLTDDKQLSVIKDALKNTQSLDQAWQKLQGTIGQQLREAQEEFKQIFVNLSDLGVFKGLSAGLAPFKILLDTLSEAAKLMHSLNDITHGFIGEVIGGATAIAALAGSVKLLGGVGALLKANSGIGGLLGGIGNKAASGLGIKTPGTVVDTGATSESAAVKNADTEAAASEAAAIARLVEARAADVDASTGQLAVLEKETAADADNALAANEATASMQRLAASLGEVAAAGEAATLAPKGVPGVGGIAGEAEATAPAAGGFAIGSGALTLSSAGLLGAATSPLVLGAAAYATYKIHQTAQKYKKGLDQAQAYLESQILKRLQSGDSAAEIKKDLEASGVLADTSVHDTISQGIANVFTLGGAGKSAQGRALDAFSQAQAQFQAPKVADLTNRIVREQQSHNATLPNRVPGALRDNEAAAIGQLTPAQQKQITAALQPGQGTSEYLSKFFTSQTTVDASSGQAQYTTDLKPGPSFTAKDIEDIIHRAKDKKDLNAVKTLDILNKTIFATPTFKYATEAAKLNQASDKKQKDAINKAAALNETGAQIQQDLSSGDLSTADAIPKLQKLAADSQKNLAIFTEETLKGPAGKQATKDALTANKLLSKTMLQYIQDNLKAAEDFNALSGRSDDSALKQAASQTAALANSGKITSSQDAATALSSLVAAEKQIYQNALDSATTAEAKQKIITQGVAIPPEVRTAMNKLLLVSTGANGVEGGLKSVSSSIGVSLDQINTAVVNAAEGYSQDSLNVLKLITQYQLALQNELIDTILNSPIKGHAGYSAVLKTLPAAQQRKADLEAALGDLNSAPGALGPQLAGSTIKGTPADQQSANDQTAQNAAALAKAKASYYAAVAGSSPSAQANAALQSANADMVLANSMAPGIARDTARFNAMTAIVNANNAIADAGVANAKARLDYLKAVSHDPLEQANLDEQIARIDIANSRGDDTKYYAGLKELDAAQEERRKALIDLANAQDQAALAATGSNRLAQSDINLKTAQRHMQEARSDAEKASAQAEETKALLDQFNSVTSLFDDIFSALSTIASAAGDAVGAASENVKKTLFDLQRGEELYKKGKIDIGQLYQLRALNAQAVADQATAQLDTAKGLSDFAYNMGEITRQQYIAQLQALLTIPHITQKQMQDVLLAIHQLQQQSTQDAQFNLPSLVNLPTLYEAQRLQQTGNQSAYDTRAGASVGYQDNRNQQIIINVNGGNPQALLKAVSTVVGANSSQYGDVGKLY